MDKTFAQIFDEKLKLTIELNNLVKEQNKQPKIYTPELTKLRNFTRSRQVSMQYYTVVLYAYKLQEEGSLTNTDKRDLANPKFLEELLNACRDIDTLTLIEELPKTTWKKVSRLVGKYMYDCHTYVDSLGMGSQFF